MIKKGLAVAVILLFIGMCVVPSNAVTGIKEKSSPIRFDGNTLYVGGSGDGNYTKIQDAIDDASNGDTVFVYNGTYYENIVIDKSISLFGEDKDTTIINTVNNWKDVLRVTADSVIIRGFTLTSHYKHGTGINLLSSYNTISDTIIKDFSRPIGNEGPDGYYPTSHNNISGNKIFGNTNGILFIWTPGYNIISKNNISSNDGCGISLSGVEPDDVYSYGNIIYGNRISKHYCGIGLTYADSNIIEFNDIISNTNKGVFLDDNTLFTIITANNFFDNPMKFGRNYEWFEKSMIRNNRNQWYNNYWDKPRELPKPIIGSITIIFGIFTFPYLKFDAFPAQEPYDIGV